MRLGGISSAGSRQGDFAARGNESAPAPQATPGRALVPVAAAERKREAADRCRPASFLAHLLAVKDDHPQTRERRRATPREAIAAYQAAAALTAQH